MNSNWSYRPETVKLGVDLCDLDLWPLTLTFCMNITLVIGNNSWKFHDDTMMGTLSKRCHRQTDRRTEIAILKAAWSQLKSWTASGVRWCKIPVMVTVMCNHLTFWVGTSLVSPVMAIRLTCPIIVMSDNLFYKIHTAFFLETPDE